jgi:hypothetical protein
VPCVLPTHSKEPLSSPISLLSPGSDSFSTPPGTQQRRNAQHSHAQGSYGINNQVILLHVRKLGDNLHKACFGTDGLTRAPPSTYCIC